MSFKFRPGLLACASSFGLVTVIAMPAHAQQAAGSKSPVETNEPAGLEEVIVTARKRSERLQDVPAAITAYTDKDMERYSTGTLTALANQTPQLDISPTGTPSGAYLSIRGVATNATSSSVDQSVSLNIDGIQISQGNAIQLGIYDLARVEILEGPQALFYGKNSPAGVISLVSANPTDQFEARVRTGYEIENAQKFGEETVSMPLSDNFGVRLDAYQSGQDGWFHNVAPAAVGTAPDKQEYFGRGTLRYDSSGHMLDSTLKISAGKVDQAGGVTATQELFACPLGYPQGAAAGTPCGIGRNVSNADMSAATAATTPFFRDGRLYFENRQFLGSWTSNLKMTDQLALTSVTGYYYLDEKWDGNYSGGFGEALLAGTHTDLHQFTQELRLLSSFDSPLNFLVGGFFQHAKLGLGVPFALAGPAAAGIFGPGAPPVLVGDDHFHQLTEAYSGFGQLLWKFAPDWELTGGGRYSHERKSVDGTRFPSLTSGFTTLPIPFGAPSLTFSNFSPEVTLSYHVVPELTLYGAFRTGFNSGGFNLAPGLSVAKPNNASFKQSTVKGGEVGAKGSAAEHQVQYGLTLYYYSYKDLQVSSFDAATFSFPIQNAAAATVRGIELNGAFNPRELPALTLRSTLTYNDAFYDRYPNAACYQGQTQALGCNGNIINGVGSARDLSGTPLATASALSGNLGATYDPTLAGNLKLALSADANYKGPYARGGNPLDRQAGAWRIDARVALHSANDNWELALIGRNLLNTLRVLTPVDVPVGGFGKGTTGPALAADQEGIVTDPRTVMLQLTVNFR
jgi:iron complex outermembrane receptor protein